MTPPAAIQFNAEAQPGATFGPFVLTRAGLVISMTGYFYSQVGSDAGMYDLQGSTDGGISYGTFVTLPGNFGTVVFPTQSVVTGNPCFTVLLKFVVVSAPKDQAVDKIVVQEVGDPLIFVPIGGGGGVPGHIIRDHNADMNQRGHLNFQGTGVTVTDNFGGDETIVTINPTSGTPGHIIQDHSVDQVQRGRLDFEGPGVVVTDDGGSGRTIATFTGAHVIQDDGSDMPQRPNLNFVGAKQIVDVGDPFDRTTIELQPPGHTIAQSGSPVPFEGVLNFEGAVVTDDSGNGRTTVTIMPGHVIQDTGTPKTQRGSLDFVGAVVTDDAGNDRTIVTFSSSGLSIQDDVDALLPSEPILQFVGPPITDDVPNTRTVVDITQQHIPGPYFLGQTNKSTPQPHYLSGLPTWLVSSIGYVDRFVGARGIYNFHEDFTEWLANFSPTGANVLQEMVGYSVYWLSGDATIVPIVTRIIGYQSGAQLLQLGNTVGPSLNDALSVWNRNPAFSITFGRQLWFTSRVQLYYTPTGFNVTGLFLVNDIPGTAPITVWDPAQFILGDGMGDFSNVLQGMYFYKAAGDTDYSFVIVKAQGPSTPPLVTTVPNVTGDNITTSGKFYPLAFRMLSNGDVVVYSDGNFVATIAHTDPTLVALNEIDVGYNAGWAVKSDGSTQNFFGYLIDNVLVAQETEADPD